MKGNIGVHRTQYRIPVPLADWLKSRAEKHFRSVNAELVDIVREAMSREPSNISTAHK